MITDQMREFNEELIDEIKQYVGENGGSSEDAFTNIYSTYIIDAGETFLSNCEVTSFVKKTEKIKINGYAYDEYFQTLTLIISDFSNRTTVEKIGKTDMDKLVKHATRFYRKCKTDYFMDIEESSSGYKIYEFISSIMSNVTNIIVVLLTNKESANYIPNAIKIDSLTVKFDIWDLERVCQYVYQNRVDQEFVVKLQTKYDFTLQLIKSIPEVKDYECYVGVIPGKYLAMIYKDEGQKLIEKNVRSFLQATGKINKGLKNTLINESDMFMAYNNGISTIADEITIESEKSTDSIAVIKDIKNWQIVNGGQTTASIYNALQNKVSLDSVNVQMKLTVIKNKDKSDEIISNISKYANSQNKINMSDFSANDSYHIKMERLSRKIYVPSQQGKSTARWFYERARGQYMVEFNRQPTAGAKKQFKELNPKQRCITKTVAAKCLMCWMKYPDIVSKGLETNFIKFSEMIKTGEIGEPSEKTYIAMISKVILFQACDKIVESLKLGGYKAQVNYYTISLLAEFYADFIDDNEIWTNQGINSEVSILLEKLILIVWNHFMNPDVAGVNITQWCKKNECWELLKKRYKSEHIDKV